MPSRPYQNVPGLRDVPRSGTPPQPVESNPPVRPLRSVSPIIPATAHSDVPIPPSQRGMPPQGHTHYGGHYATRRRNFHHANPTHARNDNDPYLAVDPFKPSIMQRFRKNAARLDNTTYEAVPASMPIYHELDNTTYAAVPASMPIYHDYPSPGQQISAEPPQDWAEGVPIRHIMLEQSESPGPSRGRSRSRSSRRTHGGESDQAPLSNKADSNSRPSESPRRSYLSSDNRDAVVVETTLSEPVALKQQDAVESVDSFAHGAITCMVPTQKRYRPSSATHSVNLPIPPPVPDTKEYSAHTDSDMLTHDEVATQTLIIAVIFDLIPRQLYLHFLLRIPYLYFSRVTRIFEETELSMAEIRKQTLENKGNPFGYFPGDKIGLVQAWESFIDSLLREWKTLNIVSVLLLSAILTILQIDVAASDPVIRYSALLSMICALMSLLYGCMYIIRFGSMKKAYKAAEWAEEAQSTTTNIFWNVWVLLAMPATWLAWSIILYVTCIAAFIWRTSPGEDTGSISISNPLWPRIVLSAILGLGFVYFVLIIATLRRYGDAMDQAWRMRVETWAQSWPNPAPQNNHLYYRNPYNPYDESGKRGFGVTSMPPVINRQRSEPQNDLGKLGGRGRDSQINSQRNSIAPEDQRKPRSRGPSPIRNTLPPVIVQIPNSSGESPEQSRPNFTRDGPSDATGVTGPSADGPSNSNSTHPQAAIKPEALSSGSPGANSTGLNHGGGDIYEVRSVMDINTMVLKHHSEIDKAGAIKVYDIGSGLDESLVVEEQLNKYRGSSLTKETFDKVAKDLRYCTVYKKHDAKDSEGAGEADLTDVFGVLKKFNDENFCPIHCRMIVCEESSRAHSVYFIPSNNMDDRPTTPE